MPTGADLIARAKTKIREITPKEASAQSKSARILDVREPGEYAQGHIPGAINIPRGLLEVALDAHPVLKDRDLPIIVHCQAGARSALATATMIELGYNKAVNMAGGFAAWKAAELPVES